MKTNETKFTAGPWLTFGPLITADDKLAPGYTLEICHTGSLADNVKHPKEEAEANARLIAASPAMFSALQAIQNRAENCPHCPGTRNLCEDCADSIAQSTRAALALAKEGE